MQTNGKIALINDKEYSVHHGIATCAVNYNEFFAPLSQFFSEVHIVGRQANAPEPLPFQLPGFTFHGVPTYENYAQFARGYRLGSAGRVARDVLAKVISTCDVVFLTVGCFFASDVEAICRRYRKPMVVEVIDDVLTSVSQTRKYTGLARLTATFLARRMDRYYARLCKDHYALILGRDLYARYCQSEEGGKCAEFFENLMEEWHYRFDRKLFSADRVRILFVGRLVQMKAVEDLIAAVHILKKSGVKTECRIVGYGDCLEDLRRSVTDAQLENEVTFSGFLKFGEEMFAAYDWADVFVLPSVGGEGVPRVLIEALGRGCLVVATDVCGIPTIVRNGATGTLVQPRRPDQIAAAIRGYRDNPLLVESVLSAAKQFCLEHTRTRQIDQLIAFLQRAMKESR